MKKLKTSKPLKEERPRRANLSEKEILQRMKEFAKRKEQFLATARASKSEIYLVMFPHLHIMLGP